MVRDAQLPSIRITQSGLDKINELRGGWTVSEYVRRAVLAAVTAKTRGPAKAGDL